MVGGQNRFWPNPRAYFPRTKCGEGGGVKGTIPPPRAPVFGFDLRVFLVGTPFALIASVENYST